MHIWYLVWVTRSKGPNVQAAKNVAALETLKILIKGFEPDDKHMLTGRAEKDMAYFDHVKVSYGFMGLRLSYGCEQLIFQIKDYPCITTED